MPPIPNNPNNNGIITLMSACGIVTPKPAQIGLTKKFIAIPKTATYPAKGLHDD